MFGVVVSGRLVQTAYERVGETQFLFNIPDADNVNHVVVFMTGTEAFPETMGGLVYFGWPDLTAGTQSWQLLGHISNQKPSAIFKISNLKKGVETLYEANYSYPRNSKIDVVAMVTEQMIEETVHQVSDETSPHPFLQPMSHMAQIGISVESLNHIALQTPVASVTPSSVDSFSEFTAKMLESFYNYAASFSLTQTTMQPNPSQNYVPLGVLQNWFINFQRRLQQNPNFWRS